MATVSEISKNDNGNYGFSVVPSGDYIDVQLVRDGNSEVYVSMSIDGLTPALQPISNSFYWSASSLFRIEHTKGKTVFIESVFPVRLCKVMDEDGTVTDVEVDNGVRMLDENGEALLTEDSYAICME